MTVWVCDDSSTARLAMSEILTAAGHAVQTFTDPVRLLTAIAIEHPDALVLDIAMPEMDAFELLISGRLPTEIPLVIVSMDRYVRGGVSLPLHNLEAAVAIATKRGYRAEGLDKRYLTRLPQVLADLLT